MSNFFYVNDFLRNVEYEFLYRYILKSSVVEVSIRSFEEFQPDSLQFGHGGNTQSLRCGVVGTELEIVLDTGERILLGRWVEEGESYKLKYTLTRTEPQAQELAALLIAELNA